MRQQLSHLFLRRWRRIAVTLIPLVFALLHISDVLHLQVLERLDNIIYDTRLRVTMPRTLDERIALAEARLMAREQKPEYPDGLFE